MVFGTVATAPFSRIVYSHAMGCASAQRNARHPLAWRGAAPFRINRTTLLDHHHHNQGSSSVRVSSHHLCLSCTYASIRSCAAASQINALGRNFVQPRILMRREVQPIFLQQQILHHDTQVEFALLVWPFLFACVSCLFSCVYIYPTIN